MLVFASHSSGCSLMPAPHQAPSHVRQGSGTGSPSGGGHPVLQGCLNRMPLSEQGMICLLQGTSAPTPGRHTQQGPSLQTSPPPAAPSGWKAVPRFLPPIFSHVFQVTFLERPSLTASTDALRAPLLSPQWTPFPHTPPDKPPLCLQLSLAPGDAAAHADRDIQGSHP